MHFPDTFRFPKLTIRWLNLLIIACTLVLTNGVVWLVELVLVGHTTPNTLKISTVSGLIIATLIVSATSLLRDRIERLHYQKLELGIARAQSHLNVALETAQMLFWELNMTTGQLHFDGGKLGWLGIPAGTPARTITEWLALIHPDDRPEFMRRFQAAMAPGAADFNLDYRVQQAIDDWGWVHTRGRVKERDGQVKPLLAVGGTLNVNQRKQTELALQRSEEKFSKAFYMTPDATNINRLQDGLYVSVNVGFCNIMGYKPEDVIGRTSTELNIWAQPEDRARMIEALKKNGMVSSFETQFRTRSGEIRFGSMSAAIIDIDGQPHIISVTRDITQRKQLEQQVHEMAFHDELTQLPNRRLLLDRLSQSMAIGKRNGRFGALIFLDLDNFKPLNDGYGHNVGDLLLLEAAQRLKSCVREIDTVARFGGDEFIVLLSDLDADRAQSTAQVELVAEKIRASLQQPYMLRVGYPGHTVASIEHICTASIGVIIFIGNDIHQDDMLKCADAAMYQAKQAGRNAVRFYQADDL